MGARQDITSKIIDGRKISGLGNKIKAIAKADDAISNKEAKLISTLLQEIIDEDKTVLFNLESILEAFGIRFGKYAQQQTISITGKKAPSNEEFSAAFSKLQINSLLKMQNARRIIASWYDVWRQESSWDGKEEDPEEIKPTEQQLATRKALKQHLRRMANKRESFHLPE